MCVFCFCFVYFNLTLFYFIFNMEASMILQKMSLIFSFSASVILLNVAQLVWHGFINPRCFLHRLHNLLGCLMTSSF